MYIFVTITDTDFVIEKMTKLCYAVHMQEILLQLGLHDNEAAMYLLLLGSPRLTAQQIADSTGIGRTNTYRIVDSLLERKLIVRDDSPVSKFSAAEPQLLQKILEEKQIALKQTAKSLAVAMPSFRSQYSLSLNKPGVYHMAGNEGIERLLRNMAVSQSEILLVASDDLPGDSETLERFRRLQTEIHANNVPIRALFHNAPYKDRIQSEFASRGMDTRFVGASPFRGEVAIYEDNVAFTVYDPSLIVTVITNTHIASTMRTLFENVWETAA